MITDIFVCIITTEINIIANNNTIISIIIINFRNLIINIIAILLLQKQIMIVVL